KIALADNAQYLVRASYLEIYNEEIRDLLSRASLTFYLCLSDPKNKLELKENMDSGVYVKDLTSFVVKSAMEIDHVMQAGKKNRSVGSTLMNQTSSRSHSIFTIVVECGSTGGSSAAGGGGDHIRVGKLNLVDLAGSERQSKTGATGDRLKEATKINLSLSALGNVISALVDGRSQHIPYRDSKLTRLLQDSLGGNTKTVMCANCGPAEYNYDETVSTLRYANRAKNIKNKPKINEDPKDAMLREFQEEIKRLKAQLAQQGGGGGAPGVIYVDGQPVQMPAFGEATVKVVKEGISEEEMKRLQEEADREKEALRKQAAADMKELLDAHARTAEERQALQQRLEAEAAERRKMEDTKAKLSAKLSAMEEKLIQGGEIMDKAARQEAELRQAQHELDTRRQQESVLARELAEKEENIMDLNREFKDLEEEVEVKTKKLKKLWTKFQTAQREVQDIQEEFQQEREDMLDTIRQLTRQLKLKEVIINNFVPTEDALKIERRAQWGEDTEAWVVPRLELSGNSLRQRRPVSATGLRRPETEYARQRKQYDSNPRYRAENIIHQELDMPERTTQEYEGPHMSSRVQPAVAASLDAEEEYVSFAAAAVAVAPPQPYLHYEPESSNGGGGGGNNGGGGGGRDGGGEDGGDGGGGRDGGGSRPKSAR
ncbi:unnamed protein product, partial [Phaeothamnion confervicola]